MPTHQEPLPRRWPALAISLLLLQALLLAVAHQAAAQPAGGELGLLASPQVGKLHTDLSYAFRLSPEQGVERQAADLGYTSHRLALFTPLVQNPTQELALSARAGLMDFNTTAVLPDSHRALPGQFWDNRLGLMYRRQLDNGWIAGLTASGGSPSDKPFNSEHELSLGAMAFVRVPQGPRDAWLFMLSYNDDRNRDLPYRLPIPGLAYWHQPSPSFQALLGVPFMSLRWLPAKGWDLTASYLMPFQVRLKAGYRINEAWKTYAAFSWSNESWYLADRANSENRVFFWQKEASLGLVRQLTPRLDLDLSLGYVFDRLIFQGENYGDRDQDRIDLEDGALVQIRLGWRI
jgi:hypothetical protein